MNSNKRHTIKLSKKLIDKVKHIADFFKAYDKGDILFFEGEVPIFVYFLEKGEISLVKSGADCKVEIMEHKKGDIVGLDLIFDNKKCTYSAIVKTSSELHVIEIEKFKQFLINENSLSLELIRYLSSVIKQIENNPIYSVR
ncbi:MAG: cyclic nucleotide-binding domain-containing protein [Flavobacteriales bacterium]|nr:cyclic nucleotide-binding domain-containing protein [Flavobacteriales bacterium]